MAVPTSLSEFLALLNGTVNNLVNAREEINQIAGHPTWINATGKAAVKAEFGTLVASSKQALDDCNAWIQSI